ncbi:orf1a polyprotein [Botrylloides leachii nidovirus]|uniref:Orf1a polyprotein n=1 Tax=Botrylloides leachii nidovirus TaxID=2509395 RepID=A0A650BL51_9NIDO|nr:orf1a polyprotein [Botrylloides leachii nidovirus]QGQ56579.1 orf1a polyprotein [Botrylloides leachii nidovirus]
MTNTLGINVQNSNQYLFIFLLTCSVITIQTGSLTLGTQLAVTAVLLNFVRHVVRQKNKKQARFYVHKTWRNIKATLTETKEKTDQIKKYINGPLTQHQAKAQTFAMIQFMASSILMFILDFVIEGYIDLPELVQNNIRFWMGVYIILCTYKTWRNTTHKKTQTTLRMTVLTITLTCMAVSAFNPEMTEAQSEKALSEVYEKSQGISQLLEMIVADFGKHQNIPTRKTGKSTKRKFFSAYRLNKHRMEESERLLKELDAEMKTIRRKARINSVRRVIQKILSPITKTRNWVVDCMVVFTFIYHRMTTATATRKVLTGRKPAPLPKEPEDLTFMEMFFEYLLTMVINAVKHTIVLVFETAWIYVFSYMLFMWLVKTTVQNKPYAKRGKFVDFLLRKIIYRLPCPFFNIPYLNIKSGRAMKNDVHDERDLYLFEKSKSFAFCGECNCTGHQASECFNVTGREIIGHPDRISPLKALENGLYVHPSVYNRFRVRQKIFDQATDKVKTVEPLSKTYQAYNAITTAEAKSSNANSEFGNSVLMPVEKRSKLLGFSQPRAEQTWDPLHLQVKRQVKEIMDQDSIEYRAKETHTPIDYDKKQGSQGKTEEEEVRSSGSKHFNFEGKVWKVSSTFENEKGKIPHIEATTETEPIPLKTGAPTKVYIEPNWTFPNGSCDVVVNSAHENFVGTGGIAKAIQDNCPQTLKMLIHWKNRKTGTFPWRMIMVTDGCKNFPYVFNLNAPQRREGNLKQVYEDLFFFYSRCIIMAGSRDLDITIPMLSTGIYNAPGMEEISALAAYDACMKECKFDTKVIFGGKNSKAAAMLERALATDRKTIESEFTPQIVKELCTTSLKEAKKIAEKLSGSGEADNLEKKIPEKGTSKNERVSLPFTSKFNGANVLDKFRINKCTITIVNKAPDFMEGFTIHTPEALAKNIKPKCFTRCVFQKDQVPDSIFYEIDGPVFLWFDEKSLTNDAIKNSWTISGFSKTEKKLDFKNKSVYLAGIDGVASDEDIVSFFTRITCHKARFTLTDDISIDGNTDFLEIFCDYMRKMNYFYTSTRSDMKTILDYHRTKQMATFTQARISCYYKSDLKIFNEKLEEHVKFVEENYADAISTEIQKKQKIVEQHTSKMDEMNIEYNSWEDRWEDQCNGEDIKTHFSQAELHELSEQIALRDDQEDYSARDQGKTLTVSLNVEATEFTPGKKTYPARSGSPVSKHMMCLLIVCVMIACVSASLTAPIVGNDEGFACKGLGYVYTIDRPKDVGNMELRFTDQIKRDYHCQMKLAKGNCLTKNGITRNVNEPEIDITTETWELMKNIPLCKGDISKRTKKRYLFCEYDAPYQLDNIVTINEEGHRWSCEIQPQELITDDPSVYTLYDDFELHHAVREYRKELVKDMNMAIQNKLTEIVMPDRCPKHMGKTIASTYCVYDLYDDDLAKFEVHQQQVNCLRTDQSCKRIVMDYIANSFEIAIDEDFKGCTYTTNGCIHYDHLYYCKVAGTWKQEEGPFEVVERISMTDQECADLIAVITNDTIDSQEKTLYLEEKPAAVYESVKRANVAEIIPDNLQMEQIVKIADDQIKKIEQCVGGLCTSHSGNLSFATTRDPKSRCAQFRDLSDFLSLTEEEAEEDCNMTETKTIYWRVSNPTAMYYMITRELPGLTLDFALYNAVGRRVILSTYCGIWTTCRDVMIKKDTCGPITGISDIDNWYHEQCVLAVGNIHVQIFGGDLKIETTGEETSIAPSDVIQIWNSKVSWYRTCTAIPYPYVKMSVSGEVFSTKEWFFQVRPDQYNKPGMARFYPHENNTLEKAIYAQSDDWQYSKYVEQESRTLFGATQRVFTSEDGTEVTGYEEGFILTIIDKFVMSVGKHIALGTGVCLTVTLILSIVYNKIYDQLRFSDSAFRRFLADSIFAFTLFILSNLAVRFGLEYGAYIVLTGLPLAKFIFWRMSGDTPKDKQKGSHYVFLSVVFTFWLSTAFCYMYFYWAHWDLLGKTLIVFFSYSSTLLSTKKPWEHNSYYTDHKTMIRWLNYLADEDPNWQSTYFAAKNKLMRIAAQTGPEFDKLRRAFYKGNYFETLNTASDKGRTGFYWAPVALPTVARDFVKTEGKQTSLESLIHSGNTSRIITTGFELEVQRHLQQYTYKNNTTLLGFTSGDKLYLQRHIFGRVEDDVALQKEIAEKIKNGTFQNELPTPFKILSVEPSDNKMYYTFLIDAEFPEFEFGKSEYGNATLVGKDFKTGKNVIQKTAMTPDNFHYSDTFAGECGSVLIQHDKIVGFHIGSLTFTSVAPLDCGKQRVNLYINPDGTIRDELKNLDTTKNSGLEPKIACSGPYFNSVFVKWLSFLYVANKGKSVQAFTHPNPRDFKTVGEMDVNVDNCIDSTWTIVSRTPGITSKPDYVAFIRTGLTKIVDTPEVLNYSPKMHGPNGYMMIEPLSNFKGRFIDLEEMMSSFDMTSVYEIESSVYDIITKPYLGLKMTYFGTNVITNLIHRAILIAFITTIDWLIWHQYKTQGFYKTVTLAYGEMPPVFTDLYINFIRICACVLLLPAHCLKGQWKFTLVTIMLRAFEYGLGTIYDFDRMLSFLAPSGNYALYLLKSCGLSALLLIYWAILVLNIGRGFYISFTTDIYGFYMVSQLADQGFLKGPLLSVVSVVFNSGLFSFVGLGVWVLFFITYPFRNNDSTKIKLEAGNTRLVMNNVAVHIVNGLKQLNLGEKYSDFITWVGKNKNTCNESALFEQISNYVEKFYVDNPDFISDYASRAYMNDAEIANFLASKHSITVEAARHVSCMHDNLFVLKLISLVSEKDARKFDTAIKDLVKCKRLELSAILSLMHDNKFIVNSTTEIHLIRRDINAQYMALCKLYKNIAAKKEPTYWLGVFHGLIDKLAADDLKINVLDHYLDIVTACQKDLATVESSDAVNEQMIALRNMIDTLTADKEDPKLTNAQKKALNRKINELEQEYSKTRRDFHKRLTMEEQQRRVDQKRQRFQLTQQRERAAAARTKQHFTVIRNNALLQVANYTYMAAKLAELGEDYPTVINNLRERFNDNYSEIMEYLADKFAENPKGARPVYGTDDKKIAQLESDTVKQPGLNGMVLPDTQAAYVYTIAEPEYGENCSIDFIAPCGAELEHTAKNHQKFACGKAYSTALAIHTNKCPTCLKHFMQGKIPHPKCDRVCNTRSITGYSIETILCSGCKKCTRCTGLARGAGEENPCNSGMHHGKVCRKTTCRKTCIFDHLPTITTSVESFQVSKIANVSDINYGYVRTKDGFDIFATFDKKRALVAHIGDNVPKGFIKVKSPAAYRHNTFSLSFDAVTAGIIYSLLSYVSATTLESLVCRQCDGKATHGCKEHSDQIEHTSGYKDVRPFMYIDGLISDKEYLNDLVIGYEDSRRDENVFNFGCASCTGKQKQFCAVQNNEFKIPRGMPQALVPLYHHVANNSLKCKKCNGGIIGEECIFCKGMEIARGEVEGAQDPLNSQGVLIVSM